MTTTSKVTAFFAALAIMATAPAAFANHDGKHHHHHEGEKHCHHRPYKYDSSVFITTNDEKVIREYMMQDAKDHWTPPTSAKKPSYQVGSVLPTSVEYRKLPGYVVHNLQPVPNGYRYVVIGKDVVLLWAPADRVVDAVPANTI